MLALIVLVVLLVYVGLVAGALWLLASRKTRMFGWALAAVVAVPTAWVGMRLFNTWSLDRELERLCAMDGGVHILEFVQLPNEQFDHEGVPFSGYRHLFASGKYLGPDYQVERGVRVLVAGDPRLQRTETRVVRIRDGKLLANWVQYARVGGGLPLPSPPTAKSCSTGPEADRFPYNVFIKQE
jgi:hypothetical protein